MSAPGLLSPDPSFNTVDGFQGQEKDIIILSCVRSGPNLSSIGFLRDFRRMNVALTRAKSSLFVIGNAATLERSDAKWKTIVGDARDRGLLIDVSVCRPIQLIRSMRGTHSPATFLPRSRMCRPLHSTDPLLLTE